MKKFHEYEKTYIGTSDIAELVFRGPEKIQGISTMEDGSVYARIVPCEVEVPEYYELIFVENFWLKIYDDERLVFNKYGKEFRIFRNSQCNGTAHFAIKIQDEEN